MFPDKMKIEIHKYICTDRHRYIKREYMHTKNILGIYVYLQNTDKWVNIYVSIITKDISQYFHMLSWFKYQKRIFLTIYKCIGVESRNITSRIVFLSQYKKRVNNYILKSANLYMMILF